MLYSWGDINIVLVIIRVLLLTEIISIRKQDKYSYMLYNIILKIDLIRNKTIDWLQCNQLHK